MKYFEDGQYYIERRESRLRRLWRILKGGINLSSSAVSLSVFLFVTLLAFPPASITVIAVLAGSALVLGAVGALMKLFKIHGEDHQQRQQKQLSKTLVNVKETLTFTLKNLKTYLGSEIEFDFVYSASNQQMDAQKCEELHQELNDIEEEIANIPTVKGRPLMSGLVFGGTVGFIVGTVLTVVFGFAPLSVVVLAAALGSALLLTLATALVKTFKLKQEKVHRAAQQQLIAQVKFDPEFDKLQRHVKALSQFIHTKESRLGMDHDVIIASPIVFSGSLWHQIRRTLLKPIQKIQSLRARYNQHEQVLTYMSVGSHGWAIGNTVVKIGVKDFTMSLPSIISGALYAAVIGIAAGVFKYQRIKTQEQRRKLRQEQFDVLKQRDYSQLMKQLSVLKMRHAIIKKVESGIPAKIIIHYLSQNHLDFDNKNAWYNRNDIDAIMANLPNTNEVKAFIDSLQYSQGLFSKVVHSLFGYRRPQKQTVLLLWQNAFNDKINAYIQNTKKLFTLDRAIKLKQDFSTHGSLVLERASQHELIYEQKTLRDQLIQMHVKFETIFEKSPSDLLIDMKQLCERMNINIADWMIKLPTKGLAKINEQDCSRVFDGQISMKDLALSMR